MPVIVYVGNGCFQGAGIDAGAHEWHESDAEPSLPTYPGAGGEAGGEGPLSRGSNSGLRATTATSGGAEAGDADDETAKSGDPRRM